MKFNPFRDLLRIFFPATCYHCGTPLVGDERYLCLNCQLQISTNTAIIAPNNITEQRLGGRIPLVAGASYMHYIKGTPSQTILHQLKYYGNTKIGYTYGQLLGNALRLSGRFDDIDVLIPVPLHHFKQWQRGYNQSEILCKGIASTFPHPIEKHLLQRNTYTQTQTHKNRIQRMENMQGVFSIKHPERLNGKHILLVDDVITTGATTDACWETLKTIPNLRISIASLAITNT